MVQKDKKSCLSRYISQKPYMMRSSCAMHKCKMMISPGVFFFYLFKILIFQIVSGVKGQKMAQWQKFYLVLHIPGSINHDFHLWYTCVKWKYLQVCFFFNFLIILIVQLVRGVKWQKIVQNDKNFCQLCPISQKPQIIWFSFILHMCKKIISPSVFVCLFVFCFSIFS